MRRAEGADGGYDGRGGGRSEEEGGARRLQHVAPLSLANGSKDPLSLGAILSLANGRVFGAILSLANGRVF